MSDMLQKRMKELMAKKGMTQLQLSTLSGHSPSYISKLLSGDRGDQINPKTLSSIAVALSTTPEWLQGQDYIHGSRFNLREIIKTDDNCRKMLDEAMQLYNGLFDRINRNEICFPYTKEEMTELCMKLEEYLNKIIFARADDIEYIFFPSPIEALYLVASCWLQDIGLFYGILGGDTPENYTPSRQHEIYCQHEERSSNYIESCWKENTAHWQGSYKQLLSSVILYHRGAYPLSEFYPLEVEDKLSDKKIRLQVLATLVRLVNACLVETARPSRLLEKLHNDLRIAPEAILNKGMTKLISEVSFDSFKKKIILTSQCPPEHRFSESTFDLREIVEIARLDLECDLREMFSILNKYSNTDFRTVESSIKTVISENLHLPEKILATWAYFLNKPTSSTETFLALLSLLDLVADLINTRKEQWKEITENILKEVLKLHPSNALVRILSCEINDLVNKCNETGGDWISLNRQLKNKYHEESQKIITACDNIARLARTYIDHDDAIIVHSFSIPIAKTLDSIRRVHKGKVYVIECDQRHRKNYYKEIDENIKIFNFVTDCGLECHFLKLSSLGQLMNEFKEKRTNVKILLGIHGIIEEKYLCQIGTSIFAMLGTAFSEEKMQGEGKRVETYILTESDKLRSFDIKEHIVPLLLQDREYEHKKNSNIKYYSNKIDVIEKKMIDSVITENGIFDPNQEE